MNLVRLSTVIGAVLVGFVLLGIGLKLTYGGSELPPPLPTAAPSHLCDDHDGAKAYVDAGTVATGAGLTCNDGTAFVFENGKVVEVLAPPE